MNNVHFSVKNQHAKSFAIFTVRNIYFYSYKALRILNNRLKQIEIHLYMNQRFTTIRRIEI